MRPLVYVTGQLFCLTLNLMLNYTKNTLGEAEMPESFSFCGRDPLNLIRIMPAQGLGMSVKGDRVPGGIRFFIFMRLKINGEIKENIRALTLQGLLDELGITSGRVAVEVNLQVIKKADYGSLTIQDGDVIEIVNFVGGG